MVARAIPTDNAATAGTVQRLFTTWRVMLTRFARALVKATDSALRRARRVVGTRRTRMTAIRDSGPSVLRSGASEVGDSFAWLFNGWRRLVSRVAALIRPRERFAVARAVYVDAYALIANPTSFGSLDASRADALAALGLRAFVLGSVATIVIGVMTPGGPGPSIAWVLNGVLWAAARLVILLALAPRDRRSRTLTTAVWSASLLPYLLGVTEVLQWVALGASAFVCYGALWGSGLRRETVRTMTAWAFGGQAGVLAAGWLFRGVLAVLANR